MLVACVTAAEQQVPEKCQQSLLFCACTDSRIVVMAELGFYKRDYVTGLIGE
jgi:hypothetical protein